VDKDDLDNVIGKVCHDLVVSQIGLISSNHVYYGLNSTLVFEARSPALIIRSYQLIELVKISVV